MPEISALSPLWLAAIFIAAALVVWFAGTRLSRYVGDFADAVGLSGAAAGMLLLGVVTSLPEIATSGSAAYRGEAALAAGDILGSIALQVVVLAVADAAIGRGALTAALPAPAHLFQGAMAAIMLIVAAAAVIVGDTAVLGMGAWTLLLAGLYFVSPFLMRAVEERRDPLALAALHELEEQRRGNGEEGGEEASPRTLLMKIAMVGLVILVAGYALATSGEGLAEATGLGGNVFGNLFLAAATSLPELSAALAAARLNRPDMAAGDVLGSNMVNLAVLGLADLIYDGGPILNALDPFSAISALLGAVLTLIFLIGLVERRDKTIFRMGYDSAAIIVVYAAGVAVLVAIE